MSKMYVKFGPNSINVKENSSHVCLHALWPHSVDHIDVALKLTHQIYLKGDRHHYYWNWMNCVLDRAGIERKNDFLWFKNEKPNFIHLVTMLVRLPLDKEYHEFRGLRKLRTIMEEAEYDPLKMALIGSSSYGMMSRAHGVGNYHIFMQEQYPISKFSFKKAVDDLKTTFHGINNAWANKIRVGVVL